MISVVINAKNEERWIVQAISSVEGFADEVVVADMASVDGTAELARSAGARVISVPEFGYVEPARRLAIDAASEPWILLLDADEVLPRTLATRLVGLAADPTVDAVVTSHATFMFGRRVFHTGWGLAHERHLRFFRRARIELPNEIHGVIRVREGARVIELDAIEELSIAHFNYVDWSHFLQKLDRYTSIEARAAVARGVRPTRRRLMQELAHEVKWRYVSAAGWKDGFTGFALTTLMLTYRLMTHAKTRQLLEVGDADAIVSRYRDYAAGLRRS